MMAWIALNAVILVKILSAIVVTDTALGSTDLVKSNSTLGAIVRGISQVGNWILSVVSPAAQVAQPPQAVSKSDIPTPPASGPSA